MAKIKMPPKKPAATEIVEDTDATMRENARSQVELLRESGVDPVTYIRYVAFMAAAMGEAYKLADIAIDKAWQDGVHAFKNPPAGKGK
jgi:hypothetical protein